MSHISNQAARMRPSISVVEVQFKPDTPYYTYLTDIPLAKGDRVVVETRDTMSLAHVVSENEPVGEEYLKELRWVIQLVDLDAHSERLKLHNELCGILKTKQNIAVREGLLAMYKLTPSERKKFR